MTKGPFGLQPRTFFPTGLGRLIRAWSWPLFRRTAEA
jgi:hypothetical protein